MSLLQALPAGLEKQPPKKLASKGAQLVLAARREDRLKNLHDEIQNNGGQSIYKVTDVTSYEKMEELPDLKPGSEKLYEMAIGSDSIARAITFAIEEPLDTECLHWVLNLMNSS